ncbi:MAG: ankyrin repeat domain-containing protein, partial [bacterium]
IMKKLIVLSVLSLLILSCGPSLDTTTKKWLEDQSKIYNFDPNNINSTDSDGRTPLHIASWQGRVDIIEDLIKNGANVNEKDLANNETPLFYGIEEERVVRVLLENGAEVNIADFEGETPLLEASRNNDVEIINLLLDNGAEVNVVNEKGYTPLLISVSYENYDVAELLVNAGADVNVENEDGYTPLIYAIGDEEIELIYKLIQEGADVNARIEKGLNEDLSVLKMVLNYELYEVVDTLIKYKLDVDQKLAENLYGEKEYALFYLIISERPELAIKFIDAGANVNIEGRFGFDKVNALYVAVRKDYIDLVDELINAGADVNYIQKNDGFTPLHIAVMHEYVDICKLLLEGGADPNIETTGHFVVCPLDYVYQPENENEEEIKELLLEYGAIR